MLHVTQPAKQYSIKHLAAWWIPPEGRGTCIRVALISVENLRNSGFERNIREIKFILGPFSQELEACALCNGLTPAGFFLNGPFLADSESGTAQMWARLNECLEGGGSDISLL